MLSLINFQSGGAKSIKKPVKNFKDELIKYSKKYSTHYKSLSTKKIATTLYKLRRIYLPKKLLQEIEEYLKIPKSKRYTGQRKAIPK